MNLLGVYNIILAYGAIKNGIAMIVKRGIYNEYPKEWLDKVPFESWFIPGVIAIIIFGIGNIIAAIFAFRKKDIKDVYMSAIMGVIFFVSLIAQVKILEDIYMATNIFFIFSIIQIILSLLAIISYKPNK